MPIEITDKYLRVRMKRPSLFRAFRTQDVGRKGHSLRVAGQKRSTGKWETQSWLVNKQDIKNKDPTTKILLFDITRELSYPEKRQLFSKINKITG